MDVQPESFRGGLGGFLGAGERRRHQVHDVGALGDAFAEVLGERLRHLPAKLGEVEFRQPAVQDTFGVVDLAVAEQMDSGLGHVYQFLKGQG